MWILGTTILLALTSLAAALSIRRRRVTTIKQMWDLPAVSTNFTQIASTLAALSFAAAVFIATLARDSGPVESAIGLFMLSFLILGTAAMQFGSIPSLQASTPARVISAQYLGHLTAATSFYIGMAMSWLGLRLLLIAVHADTSASVFTWVLFFSIVAGALRLTMHLYHHTTAGMSTCLLVPVVGLSCAALYRFGLVEIWPVLWPDRDESLFLAVVGFAVVGIGYGYQTLVLTLQTNEAIGGKLLDFGERWLVSYVQSVVVVTVLVWIAVAEA
jgi:hypothetical protein